MNQEKDELLNLYIYALRFLDQCDNIDPKTKTIITELFKDKVTFPKDDEEEIEIKVEEEEPTGNDDVIGTSKDLQKILLNGIFNKDNITITHDKGETLITLTKSEDECVKNLVNDGLVKHSDELIKDDDLHRFLNINQEEEDEEGETDRDVNNILGNIAIEIIYKHIDTDTWSKVVNKITEEVKRIKSEY